MYLVSALSIPGRRRAIGAFILFLAIALGLAHESRAQGLQTLRYDLVESPLGFFGLEFVQDFFFPVEPAQIVKTRFHLSFRTNTSTGNFPAQDIGLILQPPIDSPDPNDPGVLTGIFTGADFGWSGFGNFSYDQETDALNGVALPAPPGSGALLYGLTYFNALRLTDPGNFTPMGGQFNNSWIEVDYILIPEPSAACVISIGTIALSRRRRREEPHG